MSYLDISNPKIITWIFPNYQTQKVPCIRDCPGCERRYLADPENDIVSSDGCRIIHCRCGHFCWMCMAYNQSDWKNFTCGKLDIYAPCPNLK